MSGTQCSVCDKPFRMRFSFQRKRTQAGTVYFCSHECLEQNLRDDRLHTCEVCESSFELLYTYQQIDHDGVAHYVCKEVCRERYFELHQQQRSKMKRIAVLNQKGGTGKTTTSISLAAGLADLGHKVLIVDLDSQSNIAVSLGLKAPRTISDILLGEAHPMDCIVEVSSNLDAIISGTGLSTVETELVQVEAARHEILSLRLKSLTRYDFVILDCSPSLSVLNQNSLTYADHVLIPVSCDYLSLVGVKNIIRTIKSVNEVLMSPVDILGVVPTFYGLSEQCTRDTIRSLKGYFKDRVLHPIRVDPSLRQAPMRKQTIFEYMPDSDGARDYRALALQVAARSGFSDATPPPSPLDDEPVKEPL